MKALRTIGNVILWVFLIFAVLMTVIALAVSANSQGIPFVFGKGMVTVLTDSMVPEFKTNDFLFINQVESSDKLHLEVGEVITFLADLDKNGKQELNTHRIVAMKTGAQLNEEENTSTYGAAIVYYITKGDNNPISDTTPVRFDEVLGTYEGNKIEGLGGVFAFLKGEGFLYCIVIPLILFFLYEVYRFVILIVKANAKKTLRANEDEIKRRAVEEYLASQNQDSAAPPENSPIEEAPAVDAPAVDAPVEDAPVENKDGSDAE